MTHPDDHEHDQAPDPDLDRDPAGDGGDGSHLFPEDVGRPSPLGLALGAAAVVVGSFAVLEGTTWLALVSFPVAFLGGMVAASGWPGPR